MHLDIDADLTVAQGHDIAVDARARVMKHHGVLNGMTHVDPRSPESLPPRSPPGCAFGSRKRLDDAPDRKIACAACQSDPRG
ncbi:cation transporter dimerization domain-containing protein [Burkholderia cepacia]|uniref:cation transporter dimerization domain-containing protein n=1 Tax=Burkholderia cepacia TaxID=292 RepID=UPI003BFA05D7